MKKLVEKRNSLVEQINELFKTAETEVRAFNEEEQAKYDGMMKEISDIDAQMKRIEEQRSLEKLNFTEPKKADEKEQEDLSVKETRSFEKYVRELRAGEMKMGDNGAVIPTTIANKIIEKVENIAPLYALATKFNVKGDLTFPVADDSKKITTGYQEEFTELTSSTVGFKSVKLGGFLIGALSKVSLSLVNNAQFDIVTYVINKVAESIAKFLEKELIDGTGSTKMSGIMADTNVTEVTAQTAIGVDDLIKAQIAVPQVFQEDCRWLMNTNTLLKFRQLKDGNNRYLLQDDVNNAFGYTLLGKPVMISDNMANDKVVYGDFSAMYINIHEDINVQVLKERFATEHCVGVVAWLEMDSKVVEPQKLVRVKLGE